MVGEEEDDEAYLDGECLTCRGGWPPPSLTRSKPCALGPGASHLHARIQHIQTHSTHTHIHMHNAHIRCLCAAEAVHNDELEEEGEALREPVDFGGGAGRDSDAQRARLQAVRLIGWHPASQSEAWLWALQQLLGKGWRGERGGCPGARLDTGDKQQPLPPPQLTTLSSNPAFSQVLDDYGLLRSRHRSYISRSNRVRGGSGSRSRPFLRTAAWPTAAGLRVTVAASPA